MSVINLLLNKFKFQKRDYGDQKERYFFDYLNSFYPHEKNEGLSPALISALSFCKRSIKNNDNSSSPGVYTYKFVDSKNSTIFTAFDDEKRVFPVKDPYELINDNLDVITVIYKSMASGDNFLRKTFCLIFIALLLCALRCRHLKEVMMRCPEACCATCCAPRSKV